jgi:hypothetical protein
MVQGYESSNMSQVMEGMSRRKKMIVRIMTLMGLISKAHACVFLLESGHPRTLPHAPVCSNRYHLMS